MPTKPPRLRLGPPARKPWRQNRSAEQRGYGADHRRLRKQVLIEESLCRQCEHDGRVAATTTADHIIPLSQGGQTVRSNMQGLCDPCHKAKTAREAREGRARARP